MNSTKGKSWSDLINKVHENYDKVKEKELLSFRSMNHAQIPKPREV